MSLREEQLVDRRVTYTLEHDGKFYIVHNVPARVNEETGEQFFSPATVEKLQRVILHSHKPTLTMETPVYEYAEDLP
jgi:YgiT-type zinc finger domain-containing protein